MSAICLAHTPPGQEYVPQVFDLDGRVRSNVIQVDTIGHAFYGGYNCWLFTGDLTLFNDHKQEYDRWLSALEDRFRIPRYNLVQSGNMNENIDGSTRPMCELFTNSVIFHGCKMMAKMMALAGDAPRAKKADAFAERILSGIRTHLVNGRPPMYQLGFYLGPENAKEYLPDGMFKWANTFASRHLLGRYDADVLRNTHEELVSRSLTDFGKRRIPLGYSKPEMTLIGKYAGWYLGYTARTGRYGYLDTMLHFIAEYTQKPRDIWPEGWILHDPGWVKEENERMRTEGHRWVGFQDDPSGDYTMDSGNGEQLIISMEHLIRDVIGIDYRNGIPGIHPALPPSIRSVRIEGILLPVGNGSTGRVSYEFTQAKGSCRLKVSEMPGCALQLSVPVPKRRPLCVRLNGRNVEPESMEIGVEADRVYVQASGSRQALLEVSWQPIQ